MMRIQSIMISLIVLLAGGCTERNDHVSQPEKLSATLLLSDYRPQSIFQVEQNRIQKAAFPVIDMHSHANVKDKDGLDKWVRIMDSVGVEKTIVLTQAFGEKFDSIFALYSIYPDRFDVWCSFDYSGYDQPGYGPAAVKELERCARLGAKGVGEMGDKGSGLI